MKISFSSEILSSFLFILLIHITEISGISCFWSKKSVELKTLKILTFEEGWVTSTVRSEPVPQLQCVGDPFRCEAAGFKRITCYNPNPETNNEGIDVDPTLKTSSFFKSVFGHFKGIYHSVLSGSKWECHAELPEKNEAMNYKLGKYFINCEVDTECQKLNPGISYIVKGSCHLQYYIDLDLRKWFNTKLPSWSWLPSVLSPADKQSNEEVHQFIKKQNRMSAAITFCSLLSLLLFLTLVLGAWMGYTFEDEEYFKDAVIARIRRRNSKALTNHKNSQSSHKTNENGSGDRYYSNSKYQKDMNLDRWLKNTERLLSELHVPDAQEYLQRNNCKTKKIVMLKKLT